MKIRYSNQIKDSFSLLEIKVFVQLSYSVVPFEKLHFFEYKKIPDGKPTLTHTIPRINYKSILTTDSFSEFSERIIMYRSEENIFLLFESESLRCT